MPRLTTFSSLTETFMAPAGSKDAAAAGKAAGKTTGAGPSPLRSNRSTPKADAKSSKSAAASQKPSIVLSGVEPKEPSSTDQKTQAGKAKGEASVFDTFGGTADDDDNAPEPPRASVDMDELPIELIGLADRYVENRFYFFSAPYRTPLGHTFNTPLTYSSLQLHRVSPG